MHVCTGQFDCWRNMCLMLFYKLSLFSARSNQTGLYKQPLPFFSVMTVNGWNHHSFLLVVPRSGFKVRVGGH